MPSYTMPRPSNDYIAATYASRGTIRATADALDVAYSTLHGWITQDPELAAVFGPRTLGTPRAPAVSNELTTASEKAQVRELKATVRKLSEALGNRQEHLNEIVEAARVPAEKPDYHTRGEFQTEKFKQAFGKKLPKRSIILPIFDIQFGQLVQTVDVPFAKGGFSESIFDARLRMYLDKTKAFLAAQAVSTDFTELHIVLGGDTVEGDQIFAGQAWQLQKHPIRQVLDIRPKLTAAIKELVRFAKEELGIALVAVYAVPGNHGKVGGKRSGAIPADYSWDFLVAELVMDDLREEPIDLMVNEAAGMILFETLGHTFLTIHGDEVGGGAMGIPFYGLQKADGKFIRMSEVIHDYLLMGHIHQPAVVPNGSGGEVIVSPDWVGPNNLSRIIKAGSRPGQKVLIMAAKHGLVVEGKIWLDGEDRSQRTKATVHSVTSA